MVFSLKLAHNDELRRIAVDENHLTFEQLQQQLTKLFNFSNASVTYIDEDGDRITVDSTAELQEAVALALSLQKNALKLFVHPNNVESTTAAPKPAVSHTNESKSNTESNTGSSTSNADSNTGSSTSNADSNAEFTHPLLALADAFAPQIQVLLAQLKTEPQFVEAATNFGVDLSEPEPVKLVASLLENPILREMLESQQGSPFCGTSPFGANHPLAHLFGMLNMQQPPKSAANNTRSGSPCEAMPPNHPLAHLFEMLHGAQPKPQQPKPSSDNNTDNNNTDSNTATETKAVHRAICDACDASIVGIRWKCVSGCPDYDLCETCEPRRSVLHPGHIFAKIEKPVHQMHRGGRRGRCCPRRHPCRKQQQQKQQQKQQQAAPKPPQAQKNVEVKHETIPNGTVTTVSQPFIKIWTVTNVGNTAWPAGTRAQFTTGDKLGDHRTLVGHGAEVLPGASSHVVLECMAPDVTGPARGVWQLVAPDGRVLGGEALEISVQVIQ